MTALTQPKFSVMVPVDSPDIVAIGYFNSNLTIAFRRGPIIRYNSVPHEKYSSLLGNITEDYVEKHISGQYESKTIGEVI